MTAWNDFNDAQAQSNSFELLPNGTIAQVRMTIKPGGYDDHSQGWSEGYATLSPQTGAVYLSCEFVVLEGPYAKRKLWSNIGLHSPKGPAWANMGRSFIRAALNSAHGLAPGDSSPHAAACRRIRSFADLDGLEFTVRIEQEKDGRDELRNIVRSVIEPGQAAYGGGGSIPAAPSSPAAQAPKPAATAPTPAAGARPAWAQ